MVHGQPTSSGPHLRTRQEPCLYARGSQSLCLLSCSIMAHLTINTCPISQHAAAYRVLPSPPDLHWALRSNLSVGLVTARNNCMEFWCYSRHQNKSKTSSSVTETQTFRSRFASEIRVKIIACPAFPLLAGFPCQRLCQRRQETSQVLEHRQPKTDYVCSAQSSDGVDRLVS